MTQKTGSFSDVRKRAIEEIKKQVEHVKHVSRKTTPDETRTKIDRIFSVEAQNNIFIGMTGLAVRTGLLDWAEVAVLEAGGTIKD